MDTIEQQMRDVGFESEDGRNWKRGDYVVFAELGPTQVGPDGWFATLSWRAEYSAPHIGKSHWRSGIALPTPVAAYAHAEIEQWGGKPAEMAARDQRRSNPGAAILNQAVMGVELYNDITPQEVFTEVARLSLPYDEAAHLVSMIISRCRIDPGSGRLALSLGQLMHRLEDKMGRSQSVRGQFKNSFTG